MRATDEPQPKSLMGTNHRRRYLGAEELKREHGKRRAAIRKRLADFAAVPRGRYIHELAYCLLTPQSSARNAGMAVDALEAAGFFSSGADAAPILRRKRHYIRFHNTKARRLAEAKAMFPEILAVVEGGMSDPDIRDWLVRNVNGMGLKEASHFLRNIGRRGLAILDRHILRNLERHGVIRLVPKSLAPKRYLAIEAEFARFASSVEISVDELDLLFWSRETGEILK